MRLPGSLHGPLGPAQAARVWSASACRFEEVALRLLAARQDDAVLQFALHRLLFIRRRRGQNQQQEVRGIRGWMAGMFARAHTGVDVQLCVDMLERFSGIKVSSFLDDLSFQFLFFLNLIVVLLVDFSFLSQSSQLTCLATWIVQMYLDKMNRLAEARGRGPAEQVWRIYLGACTQRYS